MQWHQSHSTHETGLFSYRWLKCSQIHEDCHYTENDKGSNTTGRMWDCKNLSREEGMEGHARAADIRLKKYFPQETFDVGRIRGPDDE